MRATQRPIGTATRRGRRIRTACGIATAAALIAVINPAAGYAAQTPSVKLSSTTATCPLTFPEICDPSPGNRIVAKIKLGQDFTKAGLQVTQVCFDFFFDQADLLDPGEALNLTGGTGFQNVGTEPLFARTFCLQENLEDFQDGKATFDIYASIGSFKLVDVTVTYTASPIS
jgi:hypothetical protein